MRVKGMSGREAWPHDPPNLPKGDLWVFAYGSLMWRPGFEYTQAHSARLFGYHRALCVWSSAHRGTPQNPGLVLGLARGGSCIGLAFRVKAAQKETVIQYLYGRELVTPIYIPRVLRVNIRAKIVRALVFTIDRQHAQYAGRLSVEACVSVVRAANGPSGPNSEYIVNTVRHLEEMDIHDAHLSAVSRAFK